MANGEGFNGWTLILARSLTVAAILGGVGLAIAQSGMKENIEENSRAIENRRVVVETVPVIARDIENIQGDIGEIKDELRASSRAQQEILRRLPNRANP